MRNLALIALCVFTALVSGCNTSNSSSGSSGFGKVRFIIAAPVLANATLSADGTPVGTASYPGALKYQNLNQGSREIKVVAGGTTYIDATSVFSGDAHFSYIIYGDDAAASFLILSDDTTNAASGNFKLRTVNTAPGVGSVDVYVIAATADVNSSTAAATGLALGASTAFTEYAAGSFRVVLTPTGSKDIIFDSGAQSFSAGTAMTVVAYTSESGKLTNAVFLPNDSDGTSNFVANTKSRFKFVQGAPDVASANVLVDSTLALANVPYVGISGYGTYNAGDRNIVVEASTAPGSALYNQAQTLAGGHDYSFVAFSAAGTGKVGLYTFLDDNLPFTSGKAKLRVINGSSDSNAYDAYFNFAKSLSNLAAGSASSYQQVDPGTYAFSFNLAGTGTASASLSSVSILGGHVYTLYITGRAGAVSAALTQDF